MVEFWNSAPFLEAANILVASDEPLMALKLLSLVPGYYRDHYPPEMQSLKEEIYAKLATPHYYRSNEYDLLREDPVGFSSYVMDMSARGVMLLKDVKESNEAGLIPHILDLGPGEYWIPMGLISKGCKFTYQPMGLQDCVEEHVKKYIQHTVTPAKSGQPIIFFACELIEHLHHEEDLKTDLYRTGLEADVIHVSTPKYTFDGRQSQLDWRQKGELGHLRTYTPHEFVSKVTGMFLNYKWTFIDGNVMHLKGIKNG